MKERIVRALKELSSADTSKSLLLKLLKEETGLEESKLKSRASSILHAILHNYSDFAIGTIDSFVHRIVRTFAYDLHLPVNFEIEMDNDKLLGQVIDLLISKTGTDEHLTRALVEFTEAKAEDEKSWHIERDLFTFSKNLLTEDGQMHLEKLKNISTSDFLSLRNTLNETIKKFELSIQAIAKSALAIITAEGIEHSAFFQGRNGISVYFNNLAGRNPVKYDPNSYVVKTVKEGKWYTEKTSPTDKSKIDSIKEKLSEMYHQIQAILDTQQSTYYLYRLINKNIYSLAVLNEIEKLLLEIKKQNNILHISEFNKIISRIVLNQPVPFIYERIGEKYNHYLVDEFQDTSVLQWQNLLPLVENALSEAHFSMLVGDGKQAIYRWRGGEVEQFSRLPEVFMKNKSEFVVERERTLRRNYNEQQLNKNYRSKREVIEFNNSIFNTLAGKLHGNYSSIYSNLAQQFDPLNTGGSVSIQFINGETDEVEKQMLDQIQESITELINAKFNLNDIAILCRTNKTGNKVAEFLTGKAIPVISPDSLLLKNSSKVKFIESVFQYVSQPEKEITRVELVQFLVEHKLLSGDLHPLLHSIKDKKYWEFDAFLKQNNIQLNQQSLVKLPLYELTEQIVKLFHLGETADAFVQFFMDEVLSYTIKNNNNLTDFLTWWSNRKENASMNVPGGTNAVNIMTIHRSKGLEFPAVILPFASWKVSSGKDDLWIDLKADEVPLLQSALVPTSKELENTDYAHLYEEEKNKSLLDNINLLYVAFTRPEQRLYILSGAPSQKPESVGNVSDMLCVHLQSMELWNEHQSTYEFGTKTLHDSKAKNNSLTIKQNLLQSSEWKSILKIRPEAPEVWDSDEVTTKKDFGLLVHAILSKVKTAKDLPTALNQFLNAGVIDAQEMELLDTKLKKIIEHPDLSIFYSLDSTIRTEAEIILPTGETYRPDRVVLAKNKTTVIDYKTGLRSEKHVKQIKKYGELLTDMGYPATEQYLVYIDEEQIVKV